MRFRDRARTTSSSTGHGRSLPFGADLGKQEPSIALLGFFRDRGDRSSRDLLDRAEAMQFFFPTE